MHHHKILRTTTVTTTTTRGSATGNIVAGMDTISNTITHNIISKRTTTRNTIRSIIPSTTQCIITRNQRTITSTITTPIGISNIRSTIIKDCALQFLCWVFRLLRR